MLGFNKVKGQNYNISFQKSSRHQATHICIHISTSHVIMTLLSSQKNSDTVNSRKQLLLVAWLTCSNLVLPLREKILEKSRKIASCTVDRAGTA